MSARGQASTFALIALEWLNKESNECHNLKDEKILINLEPFTRSVSALEPRQRERKVL